jgi:capsular polysaccharide biosynthesis protein
LTLSFKNMEYAKLIKIILILDLLLVTFLGILSYTFLKDQYQKTRQVDPEILAQYNIGLDLNKFYEVMDEVKKQADKP